MSSLCVAVTGLSATDNPAPGVPVIRSIRAGANEDIRIVGLGYDTLDPGAYMTGIADHAFLLPYPSVGAEVMLDRLLAIHRDHPIDVLIPTLDSELPLFLRVRTQLENAGIRTFLPDSNSLQLRAKDRFGSLRESHGLSVPRSVSLTDAREISKLVAELSFPVMVKGQFYEAYIAHSMADVHARFQQIAAKWGVPVILQEYIGGDEYDVVAVGDGSGGLVGSVAMRKMQLTDKGKAWGGVTISDPKLDAFVRHTMDTLQWRGPCELEIMRQEKNGELFIIEINPRFPAWTYLCVGAGRNLPWATVQLALGEPVSPMLPAPSGVMFLRHSYDQILAMQDYQCLTTSGELHRRPSPSNRMEAVQ